MQNGLRETLINEARVGPSLPAIGFPGGRPGPQRAARPVGPGGTGRAAPAGRLRRRYRPARPGEQAQVGE